MYYRDVIFCLQALLLSQVLSFPLMPGCGNTGLMPNNLLRNNFGSNLLSTAPTIANGNAVTTMTSLPSPFASSLFPDYGPVTTTQVAPLVTEIVPALQFGDITVTGDMPVGGTIKVSGCFPIYGMVAVDGNVPTAGTAVINTGGNFVTQVIEPPCRCGIY
ncbi:hypothetical protein K1T71_014200 [Dendrolimus kikuchii]|uniref:Uncharacterized protein n=1 Tax=Dendrolimus kikuchii TaxID=765133 RepID=A0ACC1CFP7_9NEOP|nr:hypothetical protein K1T71_014200 [Dendrolimus kikuchii]